MAHLTRQQTQLIRQAIEQRGLSQPDLVEDMLDHVCSAVESGMAAGENFEQAYAQAMSSFGENELQQVQVKTQALLSGEKIFYPNMLQAGGLMLGYLLLLLLGGMIFGPIRQFDPDTFNRYVVLFETIQVCGSMVLVIGLAKLALQAGSFTRVEIFPLHPFPLSALPVISGIVLLWSVWMEVIHSWIPLPAGMQVWVVSRLPHYHLPIVLLLGILWPLLSEILFRGIILKGFLRKYTPLKAILCSSMFFAVSLLNLYNAPTLLLTGLFGGWLFYRTHSLLPSVLVQVLAVLPGLVYISLAEPQQFAQLFVWKNLMSNLAWYYGLGLASFLLTVLLIWRLKKIFDQRQPAALFSIE